MQANLCGRPLLRYSLVAAEHDGRTAHDTGELVPKRAIAILREDVGALLRRQARAPAYVVKLDDLVLYALANLGETDVDVPCPPHAVVVRAVDGAEVINVHRPRLITITEPELGCKRPEEFDFRDG